MVPTLLQDSSTLCKNPLNCEVQISSFQLSMTHKNISAKWGFINNQFFQPQVQIIFWWDFLIPEGLLWTQHSALWIAGVPQQQ